MSGSDKQLSGTMGCRKKIRAADELKRLMTQYYTGLCNTPKNVGAKIAWCSSVGPAELLVALGFRVYFPENHAAVAGTCRVATELMSHCSAEGFSRNLCSYLTTDIGAFTAGITALSNLYPAVTAIPKPDVIVFNTNQCQEIAEWFFWYGRHWNVPVYGIYTPHAMEAVSRYVTDSVSLQMQSLVSPLEKIADTRFDPERLKHTLALSLACSQLWQQVLATATTVPSPLTFFDGAVHMAAAVVLRGSQDAVAYYTLLLAEMQERIAAGTAAVDNEAIRLYWDGLPLWGRLSSHSQLFARLGAAVVGSTYCNSWVFSQFDPDDPFQSMARAYSELFIARSDTAKLTVLKKMIEYFHVNGVVFHDSKTCPYNSNSRSGLVRRLERESGCPCLVINGDANDLQFVSDEYLISQVEAFIEMIR